MEIAYKPKTLEEALKIKNDLNCTVYAGGTDLMVKYKNLSIPNIKNTVIFISDLKELKNIKINEKIEIGACVTQSELIHSNLPNIIKNISSQISSPAIRNLGTIGGNICNASPAGDLLPLLYSLDSKLTLQSYDSIQEVLIYDFIISPGKIKLKENEILTKISFKNINFNNIYYKKVGTRKSNALSKISFLGLANINNENKIEDIRISFGAVGPTVIRNKELENSLINKKVNDLRINRILNSYSEVIKPIDDLRSTSKYRKTVSLNLLENFLRGLVR
ncbi:xanthine dehydrogenase FAD-binding subunit XdhB [Tepiditoga spiralis]|uniref:Xanthine dehydrogenase FAD-binding subunit XdhB n=1 Tax=Tepiditoga spiralis TaxID=2108365 RepID=A0A7G1G9K2_9BACT|nr:FAD binding domain-containing protein [Tepiditoga spiralis]BBE29999.1 xanthine dehydrogenase FAD-binding subunit XdhB [Tepiditoga spiralis]